MRLAQPFYQLPVLFDARRLADEVLALPEEAWAPHPDRVPGNSAVRLITVDGAETDLHHGQMLPTRWLKAMPYVQQALAGFGVVWGRSRLMRLAPGVDVPEHADVNHHWHTRVRMHIPILTTPKVRFHCDGQSVHMAAGEAWIFDNWRRHHVENRSEVARVHLVADTTGTASFWRFACGPAPPRDQWPTFPWSPDARPNIMTERDQRTPIMSSAEVQLLVDDLRKELTPQARTPAAEDHVAAFDRLMESFILDWRQLCALHGLDGRGREEFQRLAEAVRVAAQSVSEGVVMGANGANALFVLEKRVLDHLIMA